VSQQNINDWTDKTGRRLEIGQLIAAAWGRELYVGRILWFTKSGVTIETEHEQHEGKQSIGYSYPGSVHLGPKRFYIIEETP